MRHRLAFVSLLAAAATADANPSILRAGANHHLGDDSFVAAFGRSPGTNDDEHARMQAHLAYVRRQLGDAPATSPERTARRQELLGYLDEYIAHGATPHNTYLPYRNPVFIDADGRICAVGYLIERSVGREVAERIAGAHRLDYLEDIAAAIPEVAAWVESSGFTLDELASIQPGYEGPDVMHVSGWTTADARTDGHYHVTTDEGVTTDGAFARHEMTGPWAVLRGEHIRGRGVFVRGAGAWTSYRDDGTKLAEGPFVHSRATGTWTFFHPSGRIAARGPMYRGTRDGRWTFYYDADGSPKLSTGEFFDGETVGPWRHYNAAGALVATARGTPWQSLELDIEPGASGVRHEIAQGIAAESFRIDGLYRGSTKLYVDDEGRMFDGHANELRHANGGWTEQACHWSPAVTRAAAAGDVRTLLEHRGLACTGTARAVSRREQERFDALLASATELHAPIPVFDIEPTPPTPEEQEIVESDHDEIEETPQIALTNADDLATYLVDHMTWYIEWPHVDDSFTAVYATLPGYPASGGVRVDE